MNVQVKLKLLIQQSIFAFLVVISKQFLKRYTSNMIMNVKKILWFNLFFYVNNFILIFLMNYFEGTSLLAIWYFTPFIIILLTTSMLESLSRIQSSSTKRLIIMDFVIRVLALCIHFILLSYLVSFSLHTLLLLEISFMLFNSVIEYIIYRKISLTLIEDIDPKIECLSSRKVDDLIKKYVDDQTYLKEPFTDQKRESQESFRLAVLSGYSYMLICLIIGGGIFAFELFGEGYQVLVVIAATITLKCYFYLTEEKLLLFYKDSDSRRKVKLRDNLTLTIGIAIVYILQGYVHIGTGTFNFLGIFIAVLFLLPSLATNQKIKHHFNRINNRRKEN